jgi:hypothetical protein
MTGLEIFLQNHRQKHYRRDLKFQSVKSPATGLVAIGYCNRSAKAFGFPEMNERGTMLFPHG